MSVEERLAVLVKDVFAATLKPRGYKKTGLRWMRRTPTARHVIGIQRSGGNIGEHLGFYINVGAYVDQFATIIGQQPIDKPKEHECQYYRRLENVVDFPHPRIDMEDWTDEALFPALTQALIATDKVLADIDSPEALVGLLSDPVMCGGLNFDLFAYRCATGDLDGIRAQYAASLSRFGSESRWPRLSAHFEQIAEQFGINLTR